MSLLFLSNILDGTRARDSAGRALAGATYTFWKSGTTAPLAVYADQTLDTRLDTDGVVTADDAGVFDTIYLQDAKYRVILKDASGRTLWDCDPYICDCTDPPYIFRSPFHHALLQENSDDADSQGGALLYFYAAGEEPGSTTPTDAYTDPDLKRPHPNPLRANAGGLFPPVYLDDEVEYRIVLKDADGNVLLDKDPYVCQCGFKYLTSKLYPLELTETMMSVGAVIRSDPSLAGPMDAMASVGSVISGTLKEPLIEFDAPVEAMESLGVVVSGTLRAPVVEIDAQAEAMESTGSIVSGTLEDVLIEYTIETEAVETIGTVVSGTLS